MSNEEIDELFSSRMLLEDETFLRELIRDLNRYLRRRAEQATAEEALSETLVALWRKRGSLPDERNELRAFAYGVARKTLLAARRTRFSSQPYQGITEGDAIMPPPQETADIRIDTARVLNALKEKDRELLLLVAWDGLPLSVAAKAIGVSSAAARKRYSRARQRLRDRIIATDDGSSGGSGVAVDHLPAHDKGDVPLSGAAGRHPDPAAISSAPVHEAAPEKAGRSEMQTRETGPSESVSASRHPPLCFGPTRLGEEGWWRK